MRGALALLLFLTAAAAADPIAPSDIEVVDGDTIRVDGRRWRLVGFDAPETNNARCPAERVQGHIAKKRLQAIVDDGALDLTEVVCNCRDGTHGTQACNYGRACGVLTSNGRDVGAMLISEGLARPYICRGTRCPRKPSWC